MQRGPDERQHHMLAQVWPHDALVDEPMILEGKWRVLGSQNKCRATNTSGKSPYLMGRGSGRRSCWLGNHSGTKGVIRDTDGHGGRRG
jgi:hypothetical protein